MSLRAEDIPVMPQEGGDAYTPPRRGRTDPAPVLLRHFRGHYGSINSVFFHPSKTQIISGSEDGNIILWDYGQNMSKRAQRFEGHSMAINDVALCGQFGDVMLSCSDDRTIRVWVPTLRGEVRMIKGHSAPVRSITCHPDNSTRFLTCSNDKTVKLWDIKHSPSTCRKMYIHSHNFVGSWRVNNNTVNSVRFHPGGETAITTSDDRSVTILDIRSPKKATAVRVDETFGLPTYAEFNPAATDYFGLASEKAMLMYDVRNTGKLVQCYQQIHTDKIVKFHFHPSGDYATCVSVDQSIKILDLVEGRPIFTLYGAHSEIKAVHTSLSGSYIATGGKDRDVLIWETELRSYKPIDFTEEEELDGSLLVNSLHPDERYSMGDQQENEEELDHVEFDNDDDTPEEIPGFSDEEDLDSTLTDENASSTTNEKTNSASKTPGRRSVSLRK